MQLAFAILFSLAASPPAAAFQGSIRFSPAEIEHHRQAAPVITSEAAACLRAELARHHSFLSLYGISAYYGENSRFAVEKTFNSEGDLIRKRYTSRAERREHLRNLGISEELLPQFVPERACASETDCPLALQPTSCIGIALRCLARGFAHAGQQAYWHRLQAFVRANDVQGDAFQHGLQRLGWKLAFWNPDTRMAEEWDAAERKTFPARPGRHRGVWGQHARSLREVQREGRYGKIAIDDRTSLVDFGETTPELLLRAPFFVGIAHRGYHVFGGALGEVLEGHSERALNDYYAVEASPFNPLSKTGGPRGGPYKSGVIALPPGLIP